MQKETYVGLIKNYLHNFNLPMIKVLKQDLYVIEFGLYLKGNTIYCALKDFSYNVGDERNKNLFHKVVSNYVYGEQYNNVTKTLDINSNIWDAYSQEYLGDYLRFIRDYRNVDMMSMYNCFSGRVLNNEIINFNIKKKYRTIDGLERYKLEKNYFANWQDRSHKIYYMPIKPFTKYTIALDCDSKIEMMACLFENGQLLYGESSGYSFSNTYRKIYNCNYTKPYVYDGVYGLAAEQFKNKDFNRYQDQLKLFIKVPVENQSSLVVLEGEYDKSNEVILTANVNQKMANKIAFANILTHSKDGEMIEYQSNQDVYRPVIPSLNRLLYTSTVNHQSISEKLLAFLYDNVISNIDSIENNIVRAQTAMQRRIPSKGRLLDINISGEFSTAEKNAAYDIAVAMGLIDNKFDINGYIDKDIEHEIGLIDEVK